MKVQHTFLDQLTDIMAKPETILAVICRNPNTGELQFAIQPEFVGQAPMLLRSMAICTEKYINSN